MKDKGFTLIELLVVMAISSVILFMLGFMLTQSTSMFKNQSESIDVQNELQVVRNHLNEAIMSAKSITIVEAGDNLVIYTGDVNLSDNTLVAEKADANGNNAMTTERIITYDRKNHSIYISNNYAGATQEGNLISSYISDMSIELDPNCIKTETTADGDVDYYVNPLSVNIELKVTSGDAEANCEMSVRVRNILKQVAIYKTEGIKTPLTNGTGNTFKVK